jgi:hypothetical protein
MTSIKRTIEQEEEQSNKIQKLEGEKIKSDFSLAHYIVKKLNESKKYKFLGDECKFDLRKFKEEFNEEEEKEEEEEDEEKKGERIRKFLIENDYNYEKYKEEFENEDEDDEENENKNEETAIEIAEIIINSIEEIEENTSSTILNQYLETLKGLAEFYKEIEDLGLKDCLSQLIDVIQEVFNSPIREKETDYNSIGEFLNYYKSEAGEIIEIICNSSLQCQ